VEAIQAGETVEVDLRTWTVRCAAGEFPFAPLSPTVLEILQAGGLIPLLRRKLGTASPEDRA
jgi:3-isopropylmalate/(R)-2-methylmalate dehydratase small subunit